MPGEESPKVEVVVSDKSGKPRNMTPVYMAVIAVVFLGIGFFARGGMTGNVVASQSDVGAKAANYLNENRDFFGLPADVSVNSVNQTGGVYIISLSMSGQRLGSIYVSPDSRYLLLGGIALDMNEPPPVEEAGSQPADTAAQTGGTTSYSQEDAEKIADFVGCLASRDVKIYGASWCGWTQKLLGIFGGAEAAAPIYVECTENEELCTSEGIQGFPTIKINGNKYSGERTFEGLSQATGCVVPSIVGSANTSGGVASCG